MNGEPLYAQVNGIRIAYDRTGEGYPVLLLHGFPRNRKVWSKVTPLLRDRFTLIAPDRRGYGDSDRPSDAAAYGNDVIAADSLELMRQLGFTEYLVVGHDRGAPVAQRLAADHAGTVRAAVILDSTPAGVPQQGPRDTTGRSWYMDFFRQRGVAEPIVGQNPRLFFSLFLDRNPHLTREEHEYYLETFCRPGTVEAVIWDYRAGLEGDRAGWEAQVKAGLRINVPLCLLWGARGPSANAPVLDLWRQVAGDVRGGMIAGSAHYVQEEQPGAVGGRILAFADELGI